MQVLLNTGDNIDHARLDVLDVNTKVEHALSAFESRITRVEIHLRDDSAGRTTHDDKRCMIEARPAGSAPVAVTCHAPTVEAAVDGAIVKIHALLESQFGRLDQVQGGESIRGSRPPS